VIDINLEEAVFVFSIHLYD